MKENIVWSDRKRSLFFGLPLSFTKYSMSENSLYVQTGFLSTRLDDAKLYRIIDITMKRTFMQRIMGLGTVVCNTADKTTPILEIKNIKKASDFRIMLSSMVENERDRKRVSGREYMGGIDVGDDMDEAYEME